MGGGGQLCGQVAVRSAWLWKAGRSSRQGCPRCSSPLKVNETRLAASVPVDGQVSCRVSLNQSQVVLGPGLTCLLECSQCCYRVVPLADAQDCVLCASVGSFPKCLIQMPLQRPLGLWPDPRRASAADVPRPSFRGSWPEPPPFPPSAQTNIQSFFVSLLLEPQCFPEKPASLHRPPQAGGAPQAM